ncbi:MAG: 4-hydroxy-3-methylbut-2-en-yl diphosphate synthase, partial [Pseudomonadota bacterium]
DIGISLPGTGEIPVCPVYVDGEKTVTLKGDHISTEFQTIVLDYVQTRYAEGGAKRQQIKPKVIALKVV